MIRRHEYASKSFELDDLPLSSISFGTGLRLGELFALKWSKVNLEHRTITIERTQTEYTDYDTNSKIYEESTPKNQTSRRTIVTYKWLMEQKRRTEQAGIESEYVIPANSGRMVKESSVTSTVKAFCNYVGAEYKWKLCLHNVFKRVDGNRKSVANTTKRT